MFNEPWYARCYNNFITIRSAVDDSLIAKVDLPEGDEARKKAVEYAARIVSCISACKDINPALIPPTLTLLNEIKKWLDDSFQKNHPFYYQLEELFYKEKNNGNMQKS